MFVLILTSMSVRLENLLILDVVKPAIAEGVAAH